MQRVEVEREHRKIVVEVGIEVERVELEEVVEMIEEVVELGIHRKKKGVEER